VIASAFGGRKRGVASRVIVCPRDHIIDADQSFLRMTVALARTRVAGEVPRRFPPPRHLPRKAKRSGALAAGDLWLTLFNLCVFI
jgi:hypothetical protein